MSIAAVEEVPKILNLQGVYFFRKSKVGNDEMRFSHDSGQGVIPVLGGIMKIGDITS